MLVEIIALAALTNLFVLAEPVNHLKSFIYKLLKKEESGFIYRLINCCLCSGFWIGLAATQSLYSAAIISIAAEFIYKKLTEGGL
jgi:hypothetical protein